MIDWNTYEPGNHRLNCPACGRKPNDKTLGLTVGLDGQGVAHCFRCNYVETHHQAAAVRRPGKTPVKPVATAMHETLSEYGLALWSACKPLYGASLGYLKGRRCAIPPEHGDLRCSPALKHPSGYTGPALVALITDARTGEAISLHRTWINADGSKAEIETPRLLLGGHRKQGGVVRLWPDEYVTEGLAVGEGIETCLSLAHAFRPVWACVDAGNLAALPVLAGVGSLFIAADNDPAGIKAANDCAARWANAGREVLLTQQPQNDINDALQGVA